MAPQTLTFPDYSPDRFANLKDTLAGYGLDAAADSGTLSKSGAEASYSYDRANQVLTVVVLKAPFFMSIGKVADMLSKDITGQQ